MHEWPDLRGQSLESRMLFGKAILAKPILKVGGATETEPANG